MLYAYIVENNTYKQQFIYKVVYLSLWRNRWHTTYWPHFGTNKIFNAKLFNVYIKRVQ